ncbi:MAG: ProQ/FinO family protein [Sulfuritalea sp.]|nr:ProQ/FinO family protein [Sulfuritalea sp.]
MPSLAPPRDPVLARLLATYPVFRDARPLVVGIHKALMAAHPEIDKGALRKTLQRHTASTKYLKAVAAGGARVGLNGFPAGEISAEQQAQAQQALKDRFFKQAEQRRELLKVQEQQAKLQQLVAKFTPR